MFGDASSSSGAPLVARVVVEQCLNTLRSLGEAELRDPQLRLALSALASTAQGLLVGEPPAAQTPRFNKTRVVDEQREEPGLPDEGHQGPQYWRTRVKSTAEKQEKKARLEKREAILRDLRSRVSQFKDDNGEMNLASESGDDDAVSFETFETRRQRASFWPEGSIEWARQLLGIELGMTQTEKRQRYLEMVKVCHPDHNRTVSPDAMQLVNAAWDVISR